jgi:hypothetical protein
MKFNEALSNIQEWMSKDESEQNGFAQFEV